MITSRWAISSQISRKFSTASKRPHQAGMAVACLPPTSFSPISPARHLCLSSAAPSRPSWWQPVPYRGLRCCAVPARPNSFVRTSADQPRVALPVPREQEPGTGSHERTVDVSRLLGYRDYFSSRKGGSDATNNSGTDRQPPTFGSVPGNLANSYRNYGWPWLSVLTYLRLPRPTAPLPPRPDRSTPALLRHLQVG
jgi:hypothetical protein